MTELIWISLTLFLLISWYKTEWGIYLTIFLLPAYQIRFQVGFVPFTLLESFILVLALIVLTKKWQTGSLSFDPRKLQAVDWMVGLFVLSSAIAVFTAPDFRTAAGIFKAYFLEAVLFFYIVKSEIKTKENLKFLFYSFAGLVTYLSVFGIFQFFSLSALPPSWWATGVASRRITSLINHPNALALLINPVIVLISLWLATKKQLTKHWGLILVCLLGLVALLLSFSRAGWLAAFVVLFLFGLFTRHRKIIFAGVLILILLVVAIPFSRDKLLSLATGNDLSQENRYVLWSAGADLVKESPLAGGGLMGFHDHFKNYEPGPDQVFQNYPHNFFLNFWVETGLFGMLSVIAFLFLFFKKCYDLFKKGEGVALAIAGAMAVIIIHGLVDVPYFKNDLSVLFWTISALPFVNFFATTKPQA